MWKKRFIFLVRCAGDAGDDPRYTSDMPNLVCGSKARISPFYVLKLFPGLLFLGDGAVSVHMVRKFKATPKALKELFFF